MELLDLPDLCHGSAMAPLGVGGTGCSEECSGGSRSRISCCKLSFWLEVWKERSCVPCYICWHVILISYHSGLGQKYVLKVLSWPKWLRYWGFMSQVNVNGILVHLKQMIIAKRVQCSVFWSCSEWLDISIMLCCNQFSRWWEVGGDCSLPSWCWVVSVEGWSQILSQWTLIEDQQFPTRCF